MSLLCLLINFLLRREDVGVYEPSSWHDVLHLVWLHSPLCFQSSCGRLPRIAQDLPRTVPLDLSNEYLDSDFLSRIEMMHTAQTEYSVGKTWFPINLFGV